MPAYQYPPTTNRFKGLIKARQFVKNPFPILDEALGKFGTTYTFFMGGVQKAVLTVDPKAMRHVLQKHHKAYEKSAIVTDLLGKYTGQRIADLDWRLLVATTATDPSPDFIKGGSMRLKP